MTIPNPYSDAESHQVLNPTEVTSFVEMPECLKCGAYDPEYRYIQYQLPARNFEALILRCARCLYIWVMEIKPE